jgi:hypothetical protein
MNRPSTTELIKAIRSATATERAELLAAIGQQPGGPVHTAATVAANVATLRQVLEVLDERQATALLSDSGLHVFGVVESDLLAVLTPFVDAHWEALESELGRVLLLCGAYGRSVLGKVERRVRDARRNRGAIEIAQVQVLMEAAKAAANESGADEGAVDADAARLYEQLLAEYAGALGGDGGGLIFGGFTVDDIGLLRSCKRFVEVHEPDVMRGDRLVLNQRLAGLFTRARQTGMDPETARNEAAIRAERAKYPNTLFAGLRKGEPAKWGGRIRDVDGRPDNGNGLWGGARDFEEMEAALRGWMNERAKEKGMELGVQHVGYLLP